MIFTAFTPTAFASLKPPGLTRWLRGATVTLASTALLAGCGTQMVNPVTGKAERSVMDEASEIAEGQKGHQEVLKEYAPYPDAKLQAYVNEIGQKLARQSHRANLTWHFTVLDSPEVNAFALPGGYVYVTRGIMAYMNSEADLAGVIGHEIGHVTARHGAQRATRQQDAGLGVLAASVLGAVLESRGVKGAGQMASNVSQNVAAGYLASYSREQELQADGLGAEYLARNQYDTGHMVGVIQVLKDQERFAADLAKAEGRPAPAKANWLSSHPSNDVRLAEIQRQAQQYQAQTQGPGKAPLADDGHLRYLQALAGLPFGESREQGLTRGQNFYHEPLGFAMTAPPGWKILNSEDALTLVNPEGSAGLIVKVAPKQAGQSHEEVIRNLLKPTEGRTQTTQINGLAATRFTGVRRNAQGQQAQVQATVVSLPAQATGSTPTTIPPTAARNFVLMPAARDAASLQGARNGLQAAETSFRAFSPADRAAARPWALQTVPYPRGGYAQLAKQSPVPQMAEGQLRLLNGHYGGGEPKLGELVKVVTLAP